MVSLRRFTNKDVHLNTETNELTYRGHTFYRIGPRYGQLVPEYNSVSPSNPDVLMPSGFPVQSTGPRKDFEVFASLWHRQIGYLHQEAVEKLPKAATGVKLKKTSLISCEPCELAKS